MNILCTIKISLSLPGLRKLEMTQKMKNVLHPEISKNVKTTVN